MRTLPILALSIVASGQTPPTPGTVPPPKPKTEVCSTLPECRAKLTARDEQVRKLIEYIGQRFDEEQADRLSKIQGDIKRLLAITPEVQRQIDETKPPQKAGQ